MRIGVVRELTEGETRVGLTPGDAAALIQAGKRVLIETCAGLAAGHPDSAYRAVGAQIVSSAEEVYARAAVLVKVHPPLPAEQRWVRDGQRVLLAPLPEATSLATLFEELT